MLYTLVVLMQPNTTCENWTRITKTHGETLTRTATRRVSKYETDEEKNYIRRKRLALYGPVNRFKTKDWRIMSDLRLKRAAKS